MLDVSNYGIRVIKLHNNATGIPSLPSSYKPIDIEGTVLALDPGSLTASEALHNKNWFKALFTTTMYAKVRWDNDYKSTTHIRNLAICSLGTLSMYWPLDAPSKDKFNDRFDFRRAEERRPITHITSPKRSLSRISTMAKSYGGAYRKLVEPQAILKQSLNDKKPSEAYSKSSISKLWEAFETVDFTNTYVNNNGYVSTGLTDVGTDAVIGEGGATDFNTSISYTANTVGF